MAEIYMRNIKDWKDATILLSLEEKGYFDEIISLIYLYDDRLPDDDELICRAMPVNKKVHNRLKKTLIKLGLIMVQDGFILAAIINVWKHSKKRTPIPTDIYNYVYQRDGYECIYCGDLEGPFELDHITPWSRGGDHEIDNLVVSCKTCNRKKGARTPIEMGWPWRRNEWAGVPNWKKGAIQ